ncbi:MAG TPA: viperin family antiviral radical SAM protein [Candidatus Dormibacteraeota bacterium]|jgi:radical S-adenosyl methionine domain-containing protein 2
MSLQIEAVNFHVWQPCNMRCAFCFGRFRDVRRQVLPEGHLARGDAAAVVALLAEAGFKKITFSGGEPFLCPWLPELVRVAKQRGMATAVVTNGSLLTDELLARLEGALDWIALSVDSIDPEALRDTGRITARDPLSTEDYLARGRAIRRHGIRLKINTVVTSANWHADLSEFILLLQPLRWKVMQVLPIEGQNSGAVNRLLIDAEQFDQFVARHRHVELSNIALVAERNEDMIGSYAMVDPAGRFFDNTRGSYTYSDSILACGVSAAIQQIDISRDKFLGRGGQYDWQVQHQTSS